MVKRITTLFIIAILLWGCKEEVDFPLEKDFPFVKTIEPVVINKDDVNLIGDLVLPVGFSNNHGEIEFGFIASTPLYTDTIFVGITDQSQQFNYTLRKRHYVDTQLKVQAIAKHDSVFYLGGQKRVEITGNNFTITGITPNTGLWQDTVSITGSRLDGYPDRTIVYFYSNAYQHFAQVIAVDSSYIEILVPQLYPAKPFYHVSVHMGMNYIHLDDVFEFNEPKITNFYPEFGFQGDTVTITGKHFGHYHETYTSGFSVTFGEHPLPIVSWNNNEIKVMMDVPMRQENHFSVKHLYYQDTSQNTFNYINPWRQLADIQFQYMRERKGFSINDFGVVGNSESFQKYNPSTNSWSNLPGMPEIDQFNSSISPMVLNNRAFIINTSSNTSPNQYNIFEFISTGPPEHWQHMGTTIMPGYITSGHSSVVANDKAFLLTRKVNNPSDNNFFEIDPVNNIWTPAPQFPSAILDFAFGMEINGMVYFGTGKTSSINVSDSFYRYDPIAKTWSQMADFPVKLHSGIGFSLEGMGYAGMGQGNTVNTFDSSIYIYDPQPDTWKWVSSFPNDKITMFPFVFTIGNVAYIGSTQSNYNNFFEFDPAYLKENYQHEK